MQILGDTNIDFLKLRKVALTISGVLIAGSLIFIGIRGGLNLGLEFTGGMETRLKFEESPQIGKVRSALTKIGMERAVIQHYGGEEENTVIIRYHLQEASENLASNILQYREEKGKLKTLEELKNVPGIEEFGYQDLVTHLTLSPEQEGRVNLNEASKQALTSVIRDVSSRQMVANIKEAIKSGLDQKNPFEVLSINFIGPKISKELQQDALLAITFGLIGMLAYIAWRFEFRFAVGAVAALVHDVLITVGVLSFAGFEFTLPVIAALLTIVGYSLNDTIVIYDRIRENAKTLRKRKLPTKRILNLSINRSLSRTIVTSLTTFIVVLILFLWGGQALQGFTFSLLAGIIAGTYSSVFIATPVIYAWGRKKRK